MRQLKITKQFTNRSEKSIDLYFQNISKLTLISPSEEVELARRIREGDQAALHALTKANLRFVITVAKQYQNQGMSLADLINEGNLGLIRAANRFDETRGFKFISYAVWWIKQSITAALMDKGRMVRLPQNKIGTINKINKCTIKLEQRLERPPTNGEIAAELGLKEEEIGFIQKMVQTHWSIDRPIKSHDDSSGIIYDVLADDNAIEPDRFLLEEDLRDDIKRCLDELTYREAFIINLSFGLNGVQPMSDLELGEFLDLTTERIGQIRRGAMRRLEKSLRKQVLVKYLA